MIIIGRLENSYFVLNKIPFRVSVSVCGNPYFAGKRNYEYITYSMDFCQKYFERITGIKLKDGTWGKFKLTPWTETDQRRMNIRKIFKERGKKKV